MTRIVRSRPWFPWFFLILFTLGLAACLPKDGGKPEGAMVRVDPAQAPVFWDDLDPESLFQALARSRDWLERLPGDAKFRFGPDTYTTHQLVASLNTFEKYYRLMGPGPDLTRAVNADFYVYKSVGRNGQGEVLVTGYYEPELAGALEPSDRRRWPLYRRPDDLIEVNLGDFSSDWEGRKIQGRVADGRLVPYYSRHEIDRQGILGGRGLELAWVDDPVALFFLHIQGSGRIRLPDGSLLRVGYSGGNGLPYTSIGKYLMEQGWVGKSAMSLQGIRGWLKANPDRMDAVMDQNQSYVFFQTRETDAVGNLGQPLTPHRSVALDHLLFPKGVLAWLDSRMPVLAGEEVTGWQGFRRFVMVQDTGGAIRGPGRLDLFFGPGPDAEARAGRMMEPGQVFFLVLKPETK